MGRIKDLSTALPVETDSFVFDGQNGTKRISLADLEAKLIEDGLGGGGGSAEAVVLTQEEYNGLSEEEKDSTTAYYIEDGIEEDHNLVTLTRAEYQRLSEADKMDGRFYYVTDEDEVQTSAIVQENVNRTDTAPSSALVKSLFDGMFVMKTQEIANISVPAGQSYFKFAYGGLDAFTPPSSEYKLLTFSLTPVHPSAILFGCCGLGSMDNIDVYVQSMSKYSSTVEETIKVNTIFIRK